MKQREIKFRAMRDDMSDCSFVYGSLCYSEGGHPRIHTGFDLAGFALWTRCLKGTEGQFTGLQDKNGKDIYEGDLVTFIVPESIGQVALPGTRKGSVTIETDGVALGVFKNEYCRNVLVIGNIYQHPELLPTNTTEGR